MGILTLLLKMIATKNQKARTHCRVQAFLVVCYETFERNETSQLRFLF